MSGIMAVGSGITMYRLLAARMVMRLAMKGIKMRNTASWAKVMRQELLLKPRASYAVIDAALTVAIDHLRPQVLADGSITKV